MQMNKRRYTPPLLAVVFAAIALAPVLAQTDKQPVAQTGAETAKKAPLQTSPNADPEPSGAQTALGQPPLANGPAGKPTQVFNPTEKIDADSSVSFPVDI